MATISGISLRIRSGTQIQSPKKPNARRISRFASAGKPDRNRRDISAISWATKALDFFEPSPEAS